MVAKMDGKYKLSINNGAAVVQCSFMAHHGTSTELTLVVPNTEKANIYILRSIYISVGLIRVAN